MDPIDNTEFLNTAHALTVIATKMADAIDRKIAANPGPTLLIQTERLEEIAVMMRVLRDALRGTVEQNLEFRDQVDKIIALQNKQD